MKKKTGGSAIVLAVLLMLSGQSHVGQAAQQKAKDTKAEKNIAQGSIMPVIKPSAFLNSLTPSPRGTPSSKAPVAYRPLNPDLLVVYALAGTDPIRWLSATEAERFENPMGIATDNLRNYFREHQPKPEQVYLAGDTKIYLLRVDNGHESSALLLNKLWMPGVWGIRGNPVVFVPVGNILLVTGDRDKEGLRVAAQMAQQRYAESAQGISPHGYIRSASQWYRYVPVTKHTKGK